MANKLLRDITGSVLVETTIVFPLFILIVFGTVDVTYMFYEWALANKAAYVGARTATLSDPVATGITSQNFDPTLLGLLCFDPNTGNSNGNCPTVDATNCTGAATNGNCINSYSWNDAPFTNFIFPRMQAIFPRLTRQNVTVSYSPTGLGFAGQSASMGGLQMNVTVSVNGVAHQFYFIGPIMRFFGGLFPDSSTIPTSATTLQSENMNSSNL